MARKLIDRLRGSSRLALVRELVRLSTPMTAAYAVVAVVLAVLPTATIIANGVLVGRLPAAFESGFDSAATRSALAALAVIGVLAVSAYAVESFGALLREHFARVASRKWDVELMTAVSRPATIAHLEDPAFLDRLEQAAGRTRAGPIQAVAVIGPVVTARLTGLFALALVFRFSWVLGALFAINAVMLRVHWRGRYDRITAAIFNQANLHRRSAYLRELAVTPPAAKELRVFGLARWLRTRFDEEWRTAMVPAFAKMRERWPQSQGLAFTTNVLILGGGWLVVDAAIGGRVSLATAIVTFQAMFGMEGISGAGDFDHMLAEGAGRVPGHLAVVRELEELAGTQQRAGADPVPPGAPVSCVEFADVRFRYPGTEADVLQGFDLCIDAHTSVAIVGLNGAGKTTIVKLLAGLHQPDAGEILVDGVPLRSLRQGEWQRRVAAIFQDFWHYPLTARDNVGFGAPERLTDQAALERAASRAGAHGIVAHLPRGWDTSLDRQFDEGVELSGGEWQRIALARAIFAVEAGATVLVLDEPTAALDVRAEADVYNRFLDITRGLTSIVISHRFSTVRRADRIVVIDGGQVVEDGSHDSLVASGGRYATMFELQAARYRDEEVTA